MKYEKFIISVKKCVEKLCPNNIVCIEKIMKNNSCEFDGLIIKREGVDTSPTIYLNGFYEEYLEGRSIDNIATEIVEIDCKNRLDLSVDIEEYRNFKLMKDRIMYKIISFEKNVSMLEKVPFRKYLDFAIIYYCISKETGDSCATWIITNDFLKIWNVDEEILFETASKNTPECLPKVIKTMSEILYELMPYEEYLQCMEGVYERTPMMYVITNRQKLFGAGVILYPDTLVNFAKEHGNFYVLPSSIHEVIFIPDDGIMESDDLKNMVMEVNRTQVQEQEFLSDEVYYYDYKDKNLHILNK